MFEWPRIAIVGAGAVGCYFGGLFALAGAPVQLIGRRRIIEAVLREGLMVEDSGGKRNISLAASVDMETVRKADLIFLCVKGIQTDSASWDLARFLPANAVLVSMQNGVENAGRMRSVTGRTAIAAAVYVSTEMIRPGHVKNSGEAEIVIGIPEETGTAGSSLAAPLARVAEVFKNAGITCRSSENITGELWLKLLWNCAGNAVTALGWASYGQVATMKACRETMLDAAREVVAVAQRAGVRMPELDLTDAKIQAAHDLGSATSSMAQDIRSGKATEIEFLNGYVVRLGKQLGVETPVNHTLYSLVKLLELNTGELGIDRKKHLNRGRTDDYAS